MVCVGPGWEQFYWNERAMPRSRKELPCVDLRPLQQTVSAPGADCKAVSACAHRGHREEQVGKGCAGLGVAWCFRTQDDCWPVLSLSPLPARALTS